MNNENNKINISTLNNNNIPNQDLLEQVDLYIPKVN